MSLSKFVYATVQTTHSGLRHSDVVKNILEKGYVHQGDISISQAVHNSLMELVKCGAIYRTESDMTRMYQGKQYITCKTARDLREKVLAGDVPKDVVDYAVQEPAA